MKTSNLSPQADWPAGLRVPPFRRCGRVRPRRPLARCGAEVATVILAVLLPGWARAQIGLSRVGSHAIEGGCNVAISGDHAYVAVCPDEAKERASGLLVLDITDPAHPWQLGAWEGEGDAGGPFWPGTEIHVEGDLAFVPWFWGEWPDQTVGLLVFDVSDPALPRLRHQVELGVSWPCVAISGEHAYRLDEGGFEVLDLSDPGNPRRVGSCTVKGWGASITVAGHLAYAPWSWQEEGARKQGLLVVDVQDPTRPLSLGRHDLGGRDGSVSSIAISGDTACLGIETSEEQTWYLQVVDVGEPAQPRLVREFKAEGILDWKIDVAIWGHFACIAADDSETPWLNNGSLQVFDLDAGTDSAIVAGYGFEPRGYPMSVAVAGDYAFLLTYETLDIVSLDALRQLDLPRPKKVFEVKDVLGAALSGRYLCTLIWDEDPWDTLLQVHDLDAPQGPEVVGQLAGLSPGELQEFSGGYAYLIGEQGEYLQVIDLNNPEQPRLVGALDELTDSRIEGLFTLDGDLACILAGANEQAPGGVWLSDMQMIDLSDRSNPRLVGRLRDAFKGVALRGDLAYVTGTDRLEVIDLSDPAHPGLLGIWHAQSAGIDTGLESSPVQGYGFRRLDLQGNHVYVPGTLEADGSPQHGLAVLDVSDPAHPAYVRFIAFSGGEGTCNWHWGVAGHYAYALFGRGCNMVSQDSARLEIMDISDPLNLRLAAQNLLFEYSRAVWLRPMVVQPGRALLFCYHPVPRRSCVLFELEPAFRSIRSDAEGITLEWEDFVPTTLQRATDAAHPDWENMPGYEATNRATLPRRAGSEFFRLVRP
ncbi:MAG: hypothetical protein H7A46_26445 [Verrucomicrobiales bacterium]|nr:hypothetical protein [Verrucomicrobiales bacterium]